MPELAKKVLARLRQERGEAPPPEPSTPASVDEMAQLPLEAREVPASRYQDLHLTLSPTDLGRLADLDAEEALFRLYWKTLPDKARARRTWPSEAQWYCQQKGLDAQIMEKLEHRCQDLREGRS